ncbi:hypothetical protein LRB82_05315 [Borreliella burgdorferi]|uniref:hypothetical protein n=1 Tax=Borreliella burgdorferi TaxID=139 RepID=UPI001304BA58|nr:hypothetical protein [Borreliella burgdorferi]MCD2386304.1 hypothetical protein [Borreliella burgdorferi]MCD2387511.1 hypothetical protein [Borreliella burgdorferi]
MSGLLVCSAPLAVALSVAPIIIRLILTDIRGVGSGIFFGIKASNHIIKSTSKEIK